MNKKVKIFFSGGGTMGSVSPLLAVYQNLKADKDIELQAFWVGSYRGPEREVIKKHKIKFISICSGKLRRYFSWRNLISPIGLLIGFCQSLFFVVVYRPQIILTAGSFVSVPLVWAGWILRVPCLVHQQDVRVGLANKLMAPFASKITVALVDSLECFPLAKTVWTGNPVRSDLFSGNKKRALADLGFVSDLPVVLIFGGGTGAAVLNDLVYKGLDLLVGVCQIIHISGKGKVKDYNFDGNILIKKRYRNFEFLSISMPDAYAAADLVVGRAGMGTISEVIALSKPAIIIPMPNTHQEDNARVLLKNKAMVVLDQDLLKPKDLVMVIKNILTDEEKIKGMLVNYKKIMRHNGADNIAGIVKKKF